MSTKFITPEGIEKQNDNCYFTSCDCIGSEHGAILDLDSEWGLSIGIDTCRIANNFWNRIRLAFRMLFTGRLDTYGDVGLRNKQHAKDIAKVLNHLADEWNE